MSKLDVLEPLPLPTNLNETQCGPMDPLLMAPKKPKARATLEVPTTTKETGSVSELFTETFVEEAPWDKDPMKNLERVFYDGQTDTLYKLFIDGTWESLKFNTR